MKSILSTSVLLGLLTVALGVTLATSWMLLLGAAAMILSSLLMVALKID